MSHRSLSPAPWLLLLFALGCEQPSNLRPELDAGAPPDGDAGLPRSCTEDRDCDDGIACTRDFCQQRRCLSRPDPAACPAGTNCDPRQVACVPGAACATDRDCMDGDPCTMNERCLGSLRVCVWEPLDGDGDFDVPRV